MDPKQTFLQRNTTIHPGDQSSATASILCGSQYPVHSDTRFCSIWKPVSVLFLYWVPFYLSSILHFIWKFYFVWMSISTLVANWLSFYLEPIINNVWIPASNLCGRMFLQKFNRPSISISVSKLFSKWIAVSGKFSIPFSNPWRHR